MKSSNIILLLIVAVIFFYFYESKTAATKADLEEVRKELKMQIDSVLQNCDTLKADVKEIKANTDTLRAGQEVIFQTMKENTNKESLLTKILRLWNK